MATWGFAQVEQNRDAEIATLREGLELGSTVIDTAELYVPFSWHEPIWLEGHFLADEGEGWKLVDSGDTEITGSMPINCSGGVLSSNPIGASGLLRFAEAALQVRGAAGEHQVEGAKTALGMAYGANSQYFSMWVVASSLQPFG